MKHPLSYVATARLVAIFLLGGCSLGPDYAAPVIDMPAAFRATPQTAVQAWPAADWWRGFNSPPLDALIGDAQANSFDIAAAIARVRQADAQVRISGSPLLPTVGTTAQGAYSGASQRRTAFNAGGFRDARSYSLGGSVSYELDFWGRLRAVQDSAEAGALFSRFDQQTVALSTVSSIALTWFQVLALQDRLDVAARNLNDASQILDAIRARLAAGTNSLLDVSQQEALVAGIRAQIPDLRSQLEQQLNGLGILTGHPPEFISGSVNQTRPGSLRNLTLPEVSAGLPSELLARRPDVAAAEADLIGANADIRAARADFFPRVDLTGSAGFLSLGLNTLFGPGSLFVNAAASAAQTVFDNGLKSGVFEQRKARYDELLAQYRRAVVQAFTDVDNAVTAYRYATEQEALEQIAVDTAQRAADIARAQLLAGTSDIVIALQAQTTLFNDLDALAQIRLARFTALVNLYKALGGGWSRGDVVRPPSTIYHGVL